MKALAFSLDGEVLASTTMDEPKIDICHSESGECVFTVTTENNPLALAFSPSKPLFAYCCGDSGRNRGSVTILNYEDKR